MEFSVRDVTDYAGMQRCADFQKTIWGAGFSELVPAAILWVSTRTGGIVAGAYDGDDALVGFIFGITGYVGRRPTHWSDMLAVLPRARGHGIGIALKQHQRTTLLGRGVDHVAWTFDPLESRNAHINFTRLGITAREYIVDCYGTSDSPLHAGLATDRLVADWRLSSDRVRARMAGGGPDAGSLATLPLVNTEAGDVRLDLNAERVRLRIPAELQELKGRDPAAAAAWRETTRRAFLAYFARGYSAVELVRNGGTSSYVLARGAES